MNDYLGRKATPYQCPKCYQWCMRGLDHDSVAGVAIVDVRPVDKLGELASLIQRRPTYDLAWRGGRYEIDFRELERIEREPPGARPGVDVVVEHWCNQPIKSYAPIRRRGATRPDIGPRDCPF